MGAYASLIFDIVILVTLGATIFYARKLSSQFAEMRDDRKAMEQLIAALNTASSRAEAAIKSLKEAATTGGDSLQEKINAARGLSDELEIMVQAGDNLAERLQGIAETSRKGAARTAAKANDEDDKSDGDEKGQPRTRAEKELLEALKAKQQS